MQTMATYEIEQHRDAQSEAVIDLVHLARYTLGNTALELEILDLFAGQTPLTIDRLRAAETDKQWREAAHTLKGSSRAVGAWCLGRLAEAAERETNWRSAEVRTSILAGLDAAFGEAETFIFALKAEG